MKEIKLMDPYGSKTIRMCESHYKKHRKYLDDAQRGGTSYYASKTNKRGCALCKKA